jgi:predicted HicB family RNase H-like nuclease
MRMRLRMEELAFVYFASAAEEEEVSLLSWLKRYLNETDGSIES